MVVNADYQNLKVCCSSSPEPIDIQWLKSNPGKLFNTPNLIRERQDMLANRRVSSCEGCWQSEEQNVLSRRQINNAHKKTHTDTESKVERLELSLGIDCNLSCSYCCKQNSSTWLQDIKNNGTYNVDLGGEDKYIINTKDKIILNLSQKEIKNASTSQLIINETVKLIPEADEIIISGGEPFLNYYLEEVLKHCSPDQDVGIVTGLGVNEKRLESQLQKISAFGFKNLRFLVSAENIKELYEFNRYGNSWSRFQNNLNLIRKYNFGFIMSMTLSNLTLFGIGDFFSFWQDKLGNFDFRYNNCISPDFLSIHILDIESKDYIRNRIKNLDKKLQSNIITQLDVEPTDLQIQNLRNFLPDFAGRRNLDLSVFPSSFVKWINNVV